MDYICKKMHTYVACAAKWYGNVNMCRAYMKEVVLACCFGELCYYAGMVLKMYVTLMG